MDTQIRRGLSDKLIWFPELNYGYLNVKEPKIDYFDEYIQKSETAIGKKLVEARYELVKKYTTGQVTDIGIGSGAFCLKRLDTFGFDIDPKAVAWLKKKKLFSNPYIEDVRSLTFWDSLEHIEEPEKLLSRVEPGQYIFISIPVFRNMEHALQSKHFKPNEHRWYFTFEGLIRYIENYEFKYRESSDVERQIGRQDITNFVFQR